jgi:hypothetical protein
MAAAIIQEPEAPEVAHITQVEDLPDPVRADIVARRQAGETLAELKTRFAHVDPAVIRDVLPAGNARERKAKEAKSKVTESTQGTGGRSGKAKSEPKPPKVEAPKPAPTPRYVEDADLLTSLSERALACRQVIGRGALAEALDTSQSAVWRAEQGGAARSGSSSRTCPRRCDLGGSRPAPPRGTEIWPIRRQPGSTTSRIPSPVYGRLVGLEQPVWASAPGRSGGPGVHDAEAGDLRLAPGALAGRCDHGGRPRARDDRGPALASPRRSRTGA